MGSGAGANLATLAPGLPGLTGGGRVTASDRARLEERLGVVRARIDAAGGAGRVTLVAVTKGFGPDVARATLEVGAGDLGENYAQELLAKAAAPGLEDARWHFLGALQTNKAARLAPVVERWHAIDRVEAAAAVGRRRPGAEVFVEVNVTGAPGRAGCAPGATEDLVAAAEGAGVHVVGLMGVAPQGDPSGARATFRWLATTAHRLGLPELSMGMSDDFEMAIEEGATTVRLGRVLFGPRPAAAGGQR